jgi:multicomponent Na+:H+ antiporter subunit C
MNSMTLAGIAGAALIGMGLFGLIAHAHLLRKIIAFNVIGGGVFLLFGAAARRGAASGLAADPVPQALVITGIVVAFSATALAVALLQRYFKETGTPFLTDDPPAGASQSDRERS